ncbi:MFS transporter [Pseudonocardia sp. CA-142604]|uniref:MFS transporter n=1 Tax=Pseudonocardia sp. CA-142604 TaxID=3240024 RepID=UPI003D91311D
MSAIDGILDTRPLRSHPAFRRIWVGTTAQSFGGQVAVVAVMYQVWELTQSAVWVGAIGVATAVPTIVFGLLGGVLADAMDRRRLVAVTSIGTAVAAVLLAVQAGLGAHSLPLVLVLVAAQTACGALGSSARRTFVARLLPPGQVPAGIALNHVSFQIAMLVGPAAAGLVLAHGGLTWAYAVDAAAITLALYGVARLPGMRPTGGTTVGLRASVDGWRFILRRPALSGSIATDLAATVLAMPIALLPVLNEERFGGDPQTLGLFLSAIAVGGITAGLTSGIVARIPRAGLVQLTAAGVWGVALAGFGLADTLLPTLACLTVAGAADTISVISRGSLVQLATPDRYLGRIVSVENVVGAGGPGIGNARAGAVADLTSAGFAAVTGGLACALVVAVLAATNPTLRRWRRPEAADEAPAVRADA